MFCFVSFFFYFSLLNLQTYDLDDNIEFPTLPSKPTETEWENIPDDVLAEAIANIPDGTVNETTSELPDDILKLVEELEATPGCSHWTEDIQSPVSVQSGQHEQVSSCVRKSFAHLCCEVLTLL